MKNKVEELQYQRELKIYEQQKKVSKFFKGVEPIKPIPPAEKSAKADREAAAKLIEAAQDLKINKAIRIAEYLDRKGIKYQVDNVNGIIRVKSYFRYEILKGVFYYATTPRTPRYYTEAVIYDIIDNITVGKTGGKNKQSFKTIMTEESARNYANNFFNKYHERYDLFIDEATISNHALTATFETSGMWKVDFFGQFKTYYMEDKDLLEALEINIQ